VPSERVTSKVTWAFRTSELDVARLPIIGTIGSLATSWAFRTSELDVARLPMVPMIDPLVGEIQLSGFNVIVPESMPPLWVTQAVFLSKLAMSGLSE
jgi:hypothetical protein